MLTTHSPLVIGHLHPIGWLQPLNPRRLPSAGSGDPGAFEACEDVAYFRPSDYSGSDDVDGFAPGDRETGPFGIVSRVPLREAGRVVDRRGAGVGSARGDPGPPVLRSAAPGV